MVATENAIIQKLKGAKTVKNSSYIISLITEKKYYTKFLKNKIIFIQIRNLFTIISRNNMYKT